MKIVQPGDPTLVLNPWWTRTEWRCSFCTCIFMLDATDYARVLLRPEPDKLIASANCPCCDNKIFKERTR